MKLLSTKEAAKKLSISVPTFYRIRNAAGFPASLRISPRRVGYIEEELDQWALSRKY